MAFALARQHSRGGDLASACSLTCFWPILLRRGRSNAQIATTARSASTSRRHAFWKPLRIEPCVLPKGAPSHRLLVETLLPELRARAVARRRVIQPVGTRPSRANVRQSSRNGPGSGDQRRTRARELALRRQRRPVIPARPPLRMRRSVCSARETHTLGFGRGAGMPARRAQPSSPDTGPAIAVKV
jgi:hypothetical protein